MKLFKRIICLVMALCMLCLAGCGKNLGGIAGVDDNISKEGRSIILRYAAWSDRELQQYLANVFMTMNPDIYVELVEIGENSWETSLQEMALEGTLPDAFWTFDIATATANGWSADITEYYDADPTTKKISDGLKVAGVYNGKRYGLVAEQYPSVVLINKTLFEKNEIALPSYDWTIDDMYSIAEKLTKAKKHRFGLGDNADTYLRDVYNAVYTSDTYQYGYNAQKESFDAKYLLEGYTKGRELFDDGIAGDPTAEQLEKWYGDSGIWLAKTGKQAMQLDWSWSIDTFKSEEFEDLDQEWVAYPFPKGESNRVQSSVNVACVSQTSAYPDKAYELLKFMTFGEDGWKARYEWYKENSLPTSVPIVNDKEIIDPIKELDENAEYSAIYDSALNSIADVKKWVPGFSEFNAWMDSQKIWSQLKDGKLKVEDAKKQMEEQLDYYYNESLNKIKSRG